MIMKIIVLAVLGSGSRADRSSVLGHRKYLDTNG